MSMVPFRMARSARDVHVMHRPQRHTARSVARVIPQQKCVLMEKHAPSESALLTSQAVLTRVACTYILLTTP